MFITIKFSKLFSRAFRADNNKVVGSRSNSKTNEIVVNLLKSKKLKNVKLKKHTNIRATMVPIFLIFSAKKVFNRLRQAFIKAPTF